MIPQFRLKKATQNGDQSCNWKLYNLSANSTSNERDLTSVYGNYVVAWRPSISGSFTDRNKG